ncbi:MAG: hypothetical protein Q7R34_08255, partial [Dehalococcoidia bacterium]|nr:hypothetical protein [Dehalococcoidia bacterium]
GIPICTVEYILKKGSLSKKLQKRDYEAVYKLRREKDWGATRIGKELSIPISTVSFILKKGKLSRLIT